MLNRLFWKFAHSEGKIREISAFLWYQLLSGCYKKSDLKFLNYGYVSTENNYKLELHDEDETNRLFAQLYSHTLSGIQLSGKNLLEIGSGRGGGTDFIARYFSPSSIVGVDLSKKAVDLCNKFYNASNLSFKQGNAQKLSFDNNCFDVVYNIESSHCYPNMTSFATEVMRVLKPGGVFAWADLRTPEVMAKDELIFLNSNLKLLSKENITPNVILALEIFSSDREKFIKKYVPSFLQSLFFEFAAVKNSISFNNFKEGKWQYWRYTFQKPDFSTAIIE